MAEPCYKYYGCLEKPEDYRKLLLNVLQGIFWLGLAAPSPVTIGLILAGVPGVAFAIILAMALRGALEATCEYYKKGKWICLEKDVCLVARAVSFEEIGYGKSGLDEIENDSAINVLLAPHSVFETREQLQADPIQGRYISRPQVIFPDWGFDGYSVMFRGDAGDLEVEVLHCVIKGCRPHDLCEAARVAWVFLSSAGILCAIPAVGWVACAIAIGIAVIVATALLTYAWFSAAEGDLESVYDDSGNGPIRSVGADGTGGDYILIQGDLVYNAHYNDYSTNPPTGGWNEISPVKSIIKIPADQIASFWAAQSSTEAEPADPQRIEAFNEQIITPFCTEASKAQGPLTGGVVSPQDDWEVHPLVDGCVEIYEGPEGPRIDNVSNVSSYNYCNSDYAVSASATSQSGVDKLELWYKYSLGSWQTKPMVLNASNGLYEAIIIPQNGIVTYYVRAYGIDGKWTDSAQYSTLLYCPA